MLATGSTVGPFVLESMLGSGGQGSVWRARDPGTGRGCALKLMPAPRERNTALARMEREARVLMDLSHPSLVRCGGMFHDPEEGVVGIVLELVDGAPLSTLRKSRELTHTHRLWILHHLLRALAYLHAAGIVHRDVKAANVLVANDFLRDPTNPENVKLVDLGIAAASGNPSPLTSLGCLVGTPSYLAPDVIFSNADPHVVATPSCDVFAFGVLGWQLLTGTHPTGLSPKDTMLDFVLAYEQAMKGETSWPARGEVHGAWGSVLRSCLALRAEDRPRNGAAVGAAIAGRAARETVQMPAYPSAPPSTPASAPSPSSPPSSAPLPSSAPVPSSAPASSPPSSAASSEDEESAPDTVRSLPPFTVVVEVAASASFALCALGAALA